MARRKTQVTSPRVQFLFVDNAQPSTANQKRRIRQHTMRKVAASRKELGTYEKYNVGQYPVFTDNAPCTVKQDVQAVVVPLDSSDDQKEDCIVQWSMPAQGYERARILFDFDLISLSTLTSIHFNRASAKVLSADRSRLRLLLASATDASYLVFVPQLYGQSTLIRLVVDCVLARAKQAVAEDACMHEQRILQLYCKALAALQSALMDKKRMFEPEVLCATHLLAIFELLDRTSTSRWESHISGLLELLQLRGPHRYTTPIERLLLSSCLGTIFSDSTTTNRDCFLALPHWTPLLTSLPPSPTTSPSLWTTVAPIPRLFRKTTKYILYSPTQCPARVISLMLHCHLARTRITSWRAGAEQALRTCTDPLDKLSHRANVGVSIAAQIMVQRLMVALDPGASDAGKLEAEAQELAARLMGMSEEGREAGCERLGLLMAQKRVIAGAVLGTGEVWGMAVRGERGVVQVGRTHVERGVFRKYCGALGREVG